MTDSKGSFDLSANRLNRRTALKGLAAGAGLAAAPGFVRYAQAQSSAPIKIGFQSHRTGIGAAYGRWYEKTTAAAVKAINAAGGINGRPVEVVIEDDGTDPGGQHHITPAEGVQRTATRPRVRPRLRIRAA